MAVIKVPRPPRSAYDPNRPISSLLKMQVDHLCAAEQRLPSRYRSEIYANAIKTEGEAAEYIRLVTEAIQQAHVDAAARRKPVPKRRRGVVEIAAVADERAERKRGRKKTGQAKKRKR